MTKHTPTDAMKIDRLLDRVERPAARERLWGRPAIARALGVSEDTISTWAKIPGVPIYEPLPGRYIAYRSELEPWLRTKQVGESR